MFLVTYLAKTTHLYIFCCPMPVVFKLLYFEVIIKKIVFMYVFI